jgi:hypothetical protein
MPTIPPFAFSNGHSDDPHENVSERFASRTLGKSPNEKNETRDYQPIFQYPDQYPDQPHLRDQPAPRSARPDSASPINSDSPRG